MRSLSETLEVEIVNRTKDEIFMGEAIQLAERASRMDEVPVGALVVLGDKVIGAASNASIKNSDPTAHAEMLAIKQASSHVGNYRLAGASLYVTIEPCTMCLGAIMHARISRLVFGALEAKGGAVVSNDVMSIGHFNHAIEVTSGVRAEICARLMSDFFRRRR
tara:strand:- start:305 stop:793 length:489 start_codon:yes stop_codon:yes gene_type:complete